ncbi:hypothetical protein R6Q57_022393 [Mikania cordata]
MAKSDNAKSLSEDYLLKDVEEKVNGSTEPEDKSHDKDAVDTTPTPPVASNPVEPPATTVVGDTESVDAAAEETVAATDNSDNDATEVPLAATEESHENTDEENATDESPEIKRQHLEIIDFQLQIKVDTALPDMLSTTGVLLQREKMLLNAINLQNIIGHFAQENGYGLDPKA